MEIGELTIRGSIDTLNIEKGINGIVLDMQKVDQKSQSVNSDFERMNQKAISLAAALGLIGASAALLNLAKSAPQVSGDLASMQMSMLQLGLVTGQTLKPAFDWFAGVLNNFVQWAQSNPDMFGFITYSIIGLSTALTAFKISSAFTGFMAFMSSPVALSIAAVAIAIYDVCDAYSKIKDLASGDSGKKGQDWGSLIGGTIGGIGAAVAAIASGVGIPATALAFTAGYAGGSFVGGKIGGMFDSPTQQSTATNSGSTQDYQDWYNQQQQEQSRRNNAMNVSVFNVGY